MRSGFTSHPAWVRELKSCGLHQHPWKDRSYPSRGAGVEMGRARQSCADADVAPHAGAGVEIVDALGWLSWNGRRTPHGVRELKDFIIILRMSTRSHCVAPCTGAGVEIRVHYPCMSHPLRGAGVAIKVTATPRRHEVGRIPHGVRELKSDCSHPYNILKKSYPSWGA